MTNDSSLMTRLGKKALANVFHESKASPLSFSGNLSPAAIYGISLAGHTLDNTWTYADCSEQTKVYKSALVSQIGTEAMLFSFGAVDAFVPNMFDLFATFTPAGRLDTMCASPTAIWRRWRPPPSPPP